MRHYFLFVFALGITTFCRADFIDQVKIYINDSLVQTADHYSGNHLYIEDLHVGDTIKLHAEVDWDDLLDSSVDIKTYEGATYATLFRFPSNAPGASFQFVVTPFYLNEPLEFWLNYNTNNEVLPWQFLTLTYRYN